MGELDLTLLRELNGLLGVVEPLWLALGDRRAAAVYGVILLILMLAQRRFVAIFVVIAAVGLSDITSARVLKPIVERPRPCAVASLVRTPPPTEGLAPCGSGASFPSSHAANTAAIAVVVQSPPLMIVSVVVGVSRVVLGQHYPSDVLAGWGLGAAIGWVIRALAEGLGMRRDA